MRKPKRRDDGDGSVYQDESGRWRAALVIDGKPVRRRAKTEKEAKAKLKELIAMRDQRLNISDGQQLLKDWCEFWLSTILPAKQVKAKTLDSHRFIVETYINPHLGHHRLTRLTAQHIDEWQRKLREQGLATGTITNARRRLHTALELARKRKLVQDNVVSLTDAPTEPVKRKEPGVSVLDEGQIRTLLGQLKAERHRLYALYVLACTTGMRQAELMGLRWGSIDLDAATLTVREQLQLIDGKLHRESTTKGGKDRKIYLTEEQRTILQAHQERQTQERTILGEAWHGEDLVFTSEDGTPLRSAGLGRQLHRALQRAGLPRVTFHSLRHSAGSIMLAHRAQLAAVSRVLGHANPAITAKIYAHSFVEEQREAVTLASAALLGE